MRISTPKQNIERQIRNIKQVYPTAIIVTDSCTGKKFNRPGWKKIYNNVKTGDTIVFDSVSRMSRNAEEGFEVYEELMLNGVTLVFLKEPYINTDMYKEALNKKNIDLTGTQIDCILEGINEYLLTIVKNQVKLAFQMAENEVLELRQRTKEGMETARLNGKQIGHPEGTKLTTKKSIEAKKIIRKHNKDFGGTLNNVDCIKLCGINKRTFYKYKRELMEELENAQ